jgi:acyl-CoA synthetase (AMP-forming)/AMP-acid ligase II
VEVEEAMMQHPGVAEAAVIGVPDEGKGEAIVGYAVARTRALVDGAGVGNTVAPVLGPMFRPREVLVGFACSIRANRWAMSLPWPTRGRWICECAYRFV